MLSILVLYAAVAPKKGGGPTRCGSILQGWSDLGIGDPIALTLEPIIYKSLVGFLKYWELEIIRERILFKICYRVIK